MALAKTPFGFGADEQEPPVPVQISLVDKMSRDRFGSDTEGAETVPPLLPQVLADPVLLQAEGKQLLRNDVPRLGRGGHRLYPSPRPLQQQPGRVQKPGFVQCQEEAVS